MLRPNENINFLNKKKLRKKAFRSPPLCLYAVFDELSATEHFRCVVAKYYSQTLDVEQRGFFLCNHINVKTRFFNNYITYT